MKKFIYIAVVLLLSTVMLVSLTACDDSSSDGDKVFHDFYSTWQDDINDDAIINDIVMPGSHDAGSKGMIGFAETQDSTIYQQLKAGVRYFDIRVHRKNNDSLVIFHSIAHGMTFQTLLADVKKFVAESPNCMIVLDFQHFENNAEPLVAELLKSELSIDTAALPTSSDIGATTIKDMRDNNYNYIITWGSNTVPSDCEELLFRRPNSLLSPYDAEQHKSTPAVLIEQFANYYDKQDDSKFFVLQCQLTPPFVLTTQLSLEKSFITKANDYVHNLRNDSATLAKTNIIMRDFILMQKETIDIIIGLNIAKNLVKATSLSSFQTFTAYSSLAA